MAVVALGAVVAGLVQGVSGFGFGMVAMSFWVWTVEPRVAAVLGVTGALTGQLVAAASMRRTVQAGTLLPFLLGGLAGLPLGVWLLPRLDMDSFRVILGAILVVWCPAMLWIKNIPPVTAGGRGADGAVGVIGGIMGGLGGFTGIAPTLWCTLRGVDKATQRAVIQNFNLTMLAVAFATYAVTGLITRDTWPLLAVMVPAMLVPSFIGTRLYQRISEAGFRMLVLGMLTLSGVVLLVSSLPRMLAH